MTDLGIRLPLRIEALEESVKVIDAVGVVAAYIYVSDDAERRQQTRRVSREQGVAMAKIIARALTEAGGSIDAKS